MGRGLGSIRKRIGVQMKKEIEPKDVRAGDTIRVEWADVNGLPRAYEYVAAHDAEDFATGAGGTYYLLALRYTWGMVIGHPKRDDFRAVYIPTTPSDVSPWLSSDGWESGKWADEALESGWVVIKKPEGIA